MTNSYWTRKLDLRIIISVTVILFLYFRSFITASLQIPFIQSYLIFVIPGFFLISALWALKKNFIIHRVQIYISIVFYISCVYIFYLKYFTNASEFIITGIGQHVFFFQLFPFMLFFSSFNFNIVSKIMDRTSIIITWLGSLYILIQYHLLINNWFTSSEIKSWLTGSQVEYLAPPGFEGTIQASSMTLVAFATYFFASKLAAYNMKLSRGAWVFVYITLIVCHYAVSLTDSITNSALFLSSTLFILAIVGIKNKQYIFTTIISIPFVFIHLYSFALRKLQAYIGHEQYSEEQTYQELFVEKFILIAKECEVKFHALQQTTSRFCSSEELHILSGTYNHGVIPDLPRLLVIFLPILLFMMILKNKRYEQYPLVMFCLVLLAGSIHYANVTNWPNVFVYQIIVVTLIKAYTNKKYRREFK